MPLTREFKETVQARWTEAMEACAKQCFDLVLMDIELPDMQGTEAASRKHSTPLR